MLAWTAEWYVREDTLREANTIIVNHHYNLPLAGVFGGGTMSSSDWTTEYYSRGVLAFRAQGRQVP